MFNLSNDFVRQARGTSFLAAILMYSGAGRRVRMVELAGAVNRLKKIDHLLWRSEGAESVEHFQRKHIDDEEEDLLRCTRAPVLQSRNRVRNGVLN